MHMSPRRILILSLALVLVVPGLLLATRAWAQAPDAGTELETTLRLHNLDLRRTATCTLIFANDQGIVVQPVQEVEIAPRQTLNVKLENQAANPDAFLAGTVDCNRRVTSVLFYGRAAEQIYTGYAGMDAGQVSSEWHILHAFTGLGTPALATRIVIQNGTVDPVPVTLQFLSADDRRLIHALDLPPLLPLSAQEVDLAQIPELATETTLRVRVQASQPVALLVFQDEAGAVDLPPRYTYVPSSHQATRFYIPAQLVNFEGMSTTLLVLSHATEPATVTLQYPQFQDWTMEVQPGAVTALPLPDFMPKANYLTPVVLSSSHPLSVLIQTAHTEGSIAALSATTTVGHKISAPLVLKQTLGFSSVVICQNTSDQPTEIIFEYVGEFARVKYVPPYQHFVLRLANETLLPATFNGAMIMRSDQLIKCFVLQIRDDQDDRNEPTPASQRSLLIYEGLGFGP